MSRLLSILITVFTLIAPSIQFTHYEENSCTIIGDPDVYGIGVRISYYLTFFSGVIALAFANHAAANDAKKGNAVIGFAVLIILIRNAMQGSLAVFEFEILFTMMFLLMGVAFIPLAMLGDRLTSAALSIVYGLYCAVLPWIFFTLKDQGRKDGCELRGFFFAYFNFFNVHWVGFLRFSAVISCIGGSTFIIGGFIYGISKLRRTKGKEEEEEDEDEKEEEKEGTQIVCAVFAFLALPIGIASIIFTEKMISGNNIDLSDSKLISTSQLLPFIVGIIGFISTAWTVTKDVMNGDHVHAKDGTAVRERKNSADVREQKDGTSVRSRERDVERDQVRSIEE
jgi:hypothetical protein